MDQWRPRIEALLREKPTATEDDIAWAAVERMSADAAALLGPAFAAHNGRNGRLSVQTDPRFYRDPSAIVRQAERFDRIVSVGMFEHVGVGHYKEFFRKCRALLADSGIASAAFSARCFQRFDPNIVVSSIHVGAGARPAVSAKSHFNHD